MANAVKAAASAANTAVQERAKKKLNALVKDVRRRMKVADGHLASAVDLCRRKPEDEHVIVVYDSCKDTINFATDTHYEVDVRINQIEKLLRAFDARSSVHQLGSAFVAFARSRSKVMSKDLDKVDGELTKIRKQLRKVKYR